MWRSNTWAFVIFKACRNIFSQTLKRKLKRGKKKQEGERERYRQECYMAEMMLSWVAFEK